MVRYIFITGGVISGLGKGIIAASIGKILISQGYSVSPVKIDPYINIDAGTMRPTEHGEAWVTFDGGETDMDLGNYERFMDIDVSKESSITTGQVYLEVIKNERSLKYDGKTVEVIPHIPEEVQRRIRKCSLGYDFSVVEIGGTVGDYQSVLFLEAARQMKLRGDDVVFVHVVYLPVPTSLGELKTKPAQHSVRELNTIGIQPDFIMARSMQEMDDIRREKLSVFCNVRRENIISCPNVDNVYEVPCTLIDSGFPKALMKLFGLDFKEDASLVEWRALVERIKTLKEEINIGVVGKYFDTGDYVLGDSYASVIEAIKHSCWKNDLVPKIRWVDAKKIEEKVGDELKGLDCIIVPGGFGKKGIEGKINAIRYARENNIPYLGLCYGMQLAVIEFARNVCGLKDAATSETDPDSNNKVVDILDEQRKNIDHSSYGGTMRLGDYEAVLRKDSIIYSLYGKEVITERHRHRYEINPAYVEMIEEKGMKFSGRSPNRVLMEFMELEGHPYFVGTQAHPEFKSTLMRPSPLFDGLMKAAKSLRKNTQG